MDLSVYIECMYAKCIYIELLRLQITAISTWIPLPKGVSRIVPLRGKELCDLLSRSKCFKVGIDWYRHHQSRCIWSRHVNLQELQTKIWNYFECSDGLPFPLNCLAFDDVKHPVKSFGPGHLQLHNASFWCSENFSHKDASDNRIVVIQ